MPVKRLTVIAIASLLLGGCVSAPPTAKPSTTPIPKPTAEPTSVSKQSDIPASSTVSSSATQSAYTEKMAQLFGYLTDAMGEINKFGIENPDFYAWTDEERLYFVLQTKIIEEAYKEVLNLTPPTQYRISHDMILAGLGKYAGAMPLIRQGLDEENADKINRANGLIEEATESLARAMEQFDKETSK